MEKKYCWFINEDIECFGYHCNACEIVDAVVANVISDTYDHVLQNNNVVAGNC